LRNRLTCNHLSVSVSQNQSLVRCYKRVSESGRTDGYGLRLKSQKYEEHGVMGSLTSDLFLPTTGGIFDHNLIYTWI